MTVVTVAVIDSGVDASHPWLAGAAIEHAKVERKGDRMVVEPTQSFDSSGHGTACAGIIHRMVPNASLLSITALGGEGRGSRDALIAALRYVVARRIDVVNLSIGIDLPKNAPLKPADHKTILDLYEIADSAYTAGVVIVASGPNAASLKTYPGRFKSLIGVGRAAFETAEGMRSEITEDHEIVAPGVDVLAPALGGGERRWTGTSFSCPHIAAHVARIRAEKPHLSIELVRAELHALARAKTLQATEAAHASA